MSEYSKLNDLLGRELGRTLEGEPFFKWEWSEDLFWPAFATGRKVLRKVEMQVPVIGGGTEMVIEEVPVPEYRRERQTRVKDTWFITKRLSAEELIWGWVGKHQERPVGLARPSHERLVELWNGHFPGAEFPEKGWRVPTDAYLPRAEGGNREPNMPDTLDFIALIREQTRLNFAERLADMQMSEERHGDAIRRQQESEIRDLFPSMLNPDPGKRGGHVSFPWSKRDRL